MMTTLSHKHSEQICNRAVLLAIKSTSVMSGRLIYSPNLLLDFANSTLRCRKAFGEKSKLGGGSFLDTDHDTVSRTPRTVPPHPSALILNTTSKNKPSYADVWALKGVGEPLPRTAGIFVFDVYKTLRFRFGSVKGFLTAPAFCTVFTAFSYYPTTCGLAVSSPSSLQLQLLSQFFGGLNLCNFTGRDS